jgi:hypothetical protein
MGRLARLISSDDYYDSVAVLLGSLMPVVVSGSQGGTGQDTTAQSGTATLGVGTWYFDTYVRNLRSFGAAVDGVTNDTVAWNAAVAWLNAAMYRCLILPAGQTLITAGAVNPITQSNISIIGYGSGATRILVTGTGIGLQVGLTPPILTTQYVYSPVLQGFAIVKTGAGTVTALTVVGPRFGRFRDLTLYTGYTAPAGDIGLDLYGKSENSFTDIWCQSDIPIRLNTPTVIAGDGVDQTNFHNLTMYSMRNLQPLILVTPGTAVGNISWTGAQTWIGGNAGFYFVDPAPTGSSGTLVFDNIRRENNPGLGADASGFSVHIDLAVPFSVFGVLSRNCRMSCGIGVGYRMDAFKIHGNYASATIEGYKDGGGAGHVFLDTSSPGSTTDSIVLLNCQWGSGTITTTNMVCATGIGDQAAGADYGGGIRIYKYTGTKGLQAVGASGAGGYSQPFWLGTYALWVASDGKLYVKSSAPAADTDGTVVGSQ